MKPLLTILDAHMWDGDFIKSDGSPYAPQWVFDALDEGILSFQELVIEGRLLPCELMLKDMLGIKRHVLIGEYIVLTKEKGIISMLPMLYATLGIGKEETCR